MLARFVLSVALAISLVAPAWAGDPPAFSIATFSADVTPPLGCQGTRGGQVGGQPLP